MTKHTALPACPQTRPGYHPAMTSYRFKLGDWLYTGGKARRAVVTGDHGALGVEALPGEPGLSPWYDPELTWLPGWSGQVLAGGASLGDRRPATPDEIAQAQLAQLQAEGL